jgi:hypothetical protein
LFSSRQWVTTARGAYTILVQESKYLERLHPLDMSNTRTPPSPILFSTPPPFPSSIALACIGHPVKLHETSIEIYLSNASSKRAGNIRRISRLKVVVAHNTKFHLEDGVPYRRVIRSIPRQVVQNCSSMVRTIQKSKMLHRVYLPGQYLQNCLEV